jgi:rubrerythrin
VAGVNRGLEGLACDVFNQLVHIARKMGDPILERAVDFVLADEITHVRMGSKWLTKLTEGDPERRRRAIEFQETIDERFNLGGRRQDGAHDAGAHLHRPRGPGARRVHGRGDRAADQDDAALAGLLMSVPVGASTRPDGDAGGPHPLQGFSSADESARLIRNYRYAVERMMRILGGWIALTPELSAKLLLGRHVWDNAQHADVLGKRLPELRALAQMSEPPNAAFVAFMNAIEEPERPDQSVERLVGVYRVLKPHLIASYEDHLRRINSVYEPPTERILVRLIEEERRHVAAGSTILRHLSAAPGLAERGEAWRAQLEELLGAAGGVTGAGLPAPARLDGPPSTPALNDDPQPVHPPRAVADPLADSRGARGGSRGLRGRAGRPRRGGTGALARVRAARGGLAGGASRRPRGRRPTAWSPSPRSATSALIKIRLEGVRAAGLSGAVTLLTRWALTADGWRAEAVDAVGLDLLPPA